MPYLVSHMFLLAFYFYIRITFTFNIIKFNIINKIRDKSQFINHFFLVIYYEFSSSYR